MNKKTVVIGASNNPSRYSYLAVNRLLQHGHDVVPVGIKKGSVAGLTIINDQPQISDVHTITLYIRPEVQKSLYNYILSLKPQRIIFNPGTENDELEGLAKSKGIETIEACTLVMLSVGIY
jgi:predicted CoA-binding protein